MNSENNGGGWTHNPQTRHYQTDLFLSTAVL